MAFPSVTATNNSAESSGTTSHTVALPADISSGDLLLVFFVCDAASADPVIGWPAGWTQFFDYGDADDMSWLAVAWRKADGEEGASITVTTTASEQSAHISYRITGHEDPTTQPPEVSLENTGSSTIPNPLSLTPTSGSKDYLWLAVQGDDDDILTTSYPTNYTDGEEKISTTGFGTCHVSLARRELATSSEDPGTFTLAASESWVAITIAIHPTEEGVTHEGVATLSGVGTLSGIGHIIAIGKATLSGIGTLAVIGTTGITQYGAAVLSGIGNLTASAVTTLVGKAALSGIGTLAGKGVITAIGKATLAGTGALSALGGFTLTAKATLSGAGSLAVIGRGIFTGATTLAGQGTLATKGFLIVIGKAVLVGVGSLAGKGIRTADVTLQPTKKDTHLWYWTPLTNYGTNTILIVRDTSGNKASRPILEFDISSIPPWATITSASLQLYYYNYSEDDPVGKTIWAYKLTRTNWVELQATWYHYKTTTVWTHAGGDYVTSDPSGGSTTFPADYGWMSWNVKAIVQDAYDSSEVAEFLVKFEAETEATGSLCTYYSKEYTTDPDLQPKLVIDYTVEGFIRYASAVLSGIGSLSAILSRVPIRGLQDFTGRILSAFTGRDLSDATSRDQSDFTGRDLADDNDEFREVK